MMLKSFQCFWNNNKISSNIRDRRLRVSGRPTPIVCHVSESVIGASFGRNAQLPLATISLRPKPVLISAISWGVPLLELQIPSPENHPKYTTIKKCINFTPRYDSDSLPPPPRTRSLEFTLVRSCLDYGDSKDQQRFLRQALNECFQFVRSNKSQTMFEKQTGLKHRTRSDNVDQAWEKLRKFSPEMKIPWEMIESHVFNSFMYSHFISLRNVKLCCKHIYGNPMSVIVINCSSWRFVNISTDIFMSIPSNDSFRHNCISSSLFDNSFGVFKGNSWINI